MHYIEKEYYSVSGNLYSNANVVSKYTDTFMVTPGDIILYTGFSNANVGGIVWFDKNMKCISYEQAESREAATEYEVPEDAKYAVCSSFEYTDTKEQLILKIGFKEKEEYIGIGTDVKNNSTQIEYLNDQVRKLNNMELPLGDSIDIITANDLSDHYLSLKGKVSSTDTSGFHSDYIPVPDYKVYLTSSKQYATALLAIYDSSKNYIAILDEKTDFSSDLVSVNDMCIDFPSLKLQYPKLAYYRVGCYPNISIFKLYRKDNIAIDKYVETQFASMKQNMYTDNILYGKKYVACGDSYTEGDFSGWTDENGLAGKNSPVIYDSDAKMYKTYPYWIAKRNGMTLINEAKCGSSITNAFDGGKNPFSVSRYKAVPTDADYITLMFGLNETSLTDEQIGNKSNSDNTTLWGAYNVVFEYFLTNMPLAKIGVIISDAWMNEKYANAVKEICKYWGVPVLDLKFDTNIAAGIDGRDDMSPKAKSLRNKAFKLSNSHPTLEAHKFRATIIENFLRSL